MKVAIIGAGISGLSCALEFEKNGIKPTIFDQKSYIGDVMSYSALWSRLFMRTFTDPFRYLEKKYGLELNPLFRLKEEIMISSHKQMTVRANLGYVVKRGREANSLENQLGEKINSTVVFNKFIELNEIADDFEYIIVATGNNTIAKEMRLWTPTFNTLNRIATILGDFNTESANLWLNTKYAKNAFAYLLPNSSKEASLTLIVNGITHHELDFYWKEFLVTENINYKITQTMDAEHNCGFINPFHSGKVYFVGNTAGLTDDLIGIGSFNAIESGIFAARAILQNLDYNKMVWPIYKDMIKLHELRQTMNSFNNHDLDYFVSFLGLPVIKQFIFRNPLFRLKQTFPMAKLYNSLKRTMR